MQIVTGIVIKPLDAMLFLIAVGGLQACTQSLLVKEAGDASINYKTFCNHALTVFPVLDIEGLRIKVTIPG